MEVAALPDVSWVPDWLTPGRFIEAVPSNDTPPILRAVSNAVAVSALPVRSPVTLAVTVVIPEIASAYTVPNFNVLAPRSTLPLVLGTILVVSLPLTAMSSPVPLPRSTAP